MCFTNHAYSGASPHVYVAVAALWLICSSILRCPLLLLQVALLSVLVSVLSHSPPSSLSKSHCVQRILAACLHLLELPTTGPGSLPALLQALHACLTASHSAPSVPPLALTHSLTNELGVAPRLGGWGTQPTSPPAGVALSPHLLAPSAPPFFPATPQLPAAGGREGAEAVAVVGRALPDLVDLLLGWLLDPAVALADRWG